MANERLKDYISFVKVSSSWELNMAKEKPQPPVPYPPKDAGGVVPRNA